ncbi:DivIVA domain-containing protein [Streptomyces sp. CG 926]|nr:DivIVA domain-containing protein [Streptomyces sp. CG 926]
MDIRNQVFTTVRLREGYDLVEVDDFLSRVEAAMTAVLQENAALRSRVDIATEATRQAEEGARQAAEPRSGRAERIIALAQTVADQAVADAYVQAQCIVADAEERAAAIERQARDQVAGIRLQADGLHVHAQEYRSQLRAGLETQIRSAEEQLRRLEAEHHVSAPGQAPAGAHSAAVALLRQPGADWGIVQQRDGRGGSENSA